VRPIVPGSLVFGAGRPERRGDRLHVDDGIGDAGSQQSTPDRLLGAAMSSSNATAVRIVFLIGAKYLRLSWRSSAPSIPVLAVRVGAGLDQVRPIEL
jgi:hypothetical protein